MFKQIFKWLFRIFLLLLVAGTVFLVNLIWFRPWSLNLFYEKVFVETVFRMPELLSALGLVEQFGLTSHNGKLNDESPARQQELMDLWKKDLTHLRQYPPAKQSPSQRLSTRILEYFLQDQVDGEKWQWHNYPVNQFFGAQSEFPSFMASIHRLLNKKDCEYYIMRLDALPRKFDQLLEGLKLREQKQIVPPRFVIEKVLKEMGDFVATPVGKNILTSSFKERAAKIDKLTESDRTEFAARAEKSVTERVYPAYRKLIAYFTALLPKATTDDGVWKLPEGDAFYAHVLRGHTTTKLQPEEIHALGLGEVARIEAEMRSLLDSNGFNAVAIGVAMDTLTKDPKFLYPNDEPGRAAALAEYGRLIDAATEQSKKLFLTMPRAKCEVRRTPEFKEATSSGAYYNPPAQDGTRPGIFFANLRDMAEIPKWSMPTLAYHEGVPGHHFQIAIAQEITGVPQFRKVLPFTAYAEGWALYTEWLAKQAGWYEGDPFGDLGRARDELFRAVRLVVDTGIHAKRWTREQAIAYMREKTGLGEKEVTSEIERYIVIPGQACAYKVGMLKIQELRRRAEQELGVKFDVRDFHEVVLQGGGLPLEVLEERITEYMSRKKS